MHKIRIIIMALVAICAAVAAYLFWPSDAPPPPEQSSAVQHGPVVPQPMFPSVHIPPDEPMEEEIDVDQIPVVPETELDDPITSVASLSLPFFDDLAQRILDRYHPAQTLHNSGRTGVLLISLSALNRVYGVDFVGLEHSGASVMEAREEIFSALLQPEIVDLAWQAFSAYFQQTLIDQALAATRFVNGPDGVRVERPLTVGEVAEFLQLVSNSLRRIAQAARIYVLSNQAVETTQAWLNARADALAANSRYQHAEALLEQILLESPDDQDQIHALRVERDAASRDILQTIEIRERAKGELLELYATDSQTRKMSETDLLYVSQWLFRRLHQNPERRDGLALLTDRVQELASGLHEAAAAITAQPPE